MKKIRQTGRENRQVKKSRAGNLGNKKTAISEIKMQLRRIKTREAIRVIIQALKLNTAGKIILNEGLINLLEKEESSD